ncbi:MAG: Stk1 family PASTA domain-containing Ser/Thr kinase [Ruminococcaceae bacterium]|nr:Stk1 family PASTA domain-containing Ser/Thr kinase [Oscillospiraceae bacterium]
MDKYVGKRLDGRYEIQEIIGVGGMAVVYKARDNVEDRIVAIKILKDEFVSNEEFIRRFKNESRAIAMLSHQNIVKVYDVSFGDLIQYIVMEYIDGITLKELIERQGSLRWKDAVHFTIQILKGLQHAHDKGIVHRDVKPQNIMVLPDGTIKVTDFGIARFARSEQRTITDKAIGSVHYISPEQARGEKTDEKTDIYSVGVMMYEMLTGRLPFEAESAVSVAIMQLQRDPQLPTEINGSIPLGLEQITMHAMQKIPEKRYQSAAEMLCDLEEFRKDPSATFSYTYFVDDSPTKYVGNVRSATPASANMPEERVEQAEEEHTQNNMIPILAGVAAAVFIALVVIGIIFIPRLFSNTGAEIPCPDFVGMTWESISKNATYNEQFDIEAEWSTDDDTEYGYVFDQDQAAKKKLKKGAKITLKVSSGQATVKVPDVHGKSESQAVSELKAMKFKVLISEMASEEVEAGKVIKTEPAMTSKQLPGAEITVYVSTGKPTKYVKLKDFTGFNKEKAISEIEKEGLTYKIEEVDIAPNAKYFEKDFVVSQTPDANEEVVEGSTVTLKVSTGKYKFDLNVKLPSDCKHSFGKVSIWVDKKLYVESEKIKINEIGSYTFKDFKSESKKLNAEIRFTQDGSDYVLYQTIKIDCEKGTHTVEERHNDYKASENNSSLNSSSTNNSSGAVGG